MRMIIKIIMQISQFYFLITKIVRRQELLALASVPAKNLEIFHDKGGHLTAQQNIIPKRNIFQRNCCVIISNNC